MSLHAEARRRCTEWLDSQALADELGISRRTIESWRVKGGEGPVFVRIGHLVRYRREDVEAWLESQTRRSTSDLGPAGRR